MSRAQRVLRSLRCAMQSRSAPYSRQQEGFLVGLGQTSLVSVTRRQPSSTYRYGRLCKAQSDVVGVQEIGLWQAALVVRIATGGAFRAVFIKLHKSSHHAKHFPLCVDCTSRSVQHPS